MICQGLSSHFLFPQSLAVFIVPHFAASEKIIGLHNCSGLGLNAILRNNFLILKKKF